MKREKRKKVRKIERAPISSGREIVREEIVREERVREGVREKVRE